MDHGQLAAMVDLPDCRYAVLESLRSYAVVDDGLTLERPDYEQGKQHVNCGRILVPVPPMANNYFQKTN